MGSICHGQLYDCQNQLCGFIHVIRLIENQFKEDDQQMTLVTSQEYSSFQRMFGETIEEAIVRYHILHGRAAERGLDERNPIRRALSLLKAFKIPQNALPMILPHTNGQIPENDGQIDQMLTYIKGWAKIMEPNKLLEALSSTCWSRRQPIASLEKKRSKQLQRHKGERGSGGWWCPKIYLTFNVLFPKPI